MIVGIDGHDAGISQKEHVGRDLIPLGGHTLAGLQQARLDIVEGLEVAIQAMDVIGCHHEASS